MRAVKRLCEGVRKNWKREDEKEREKKRRDSEKKIIIKKWKKKKDMTPQNTEAI